MNSRPRPTLPLPTSLPVLQRGSHAHPDDGACFMEFASVLAGERFTDRPVCTHPVLAGVARAVNDSVGDAARQRLLPLVPDVIGVGREDLRLGPALVGLCTQRALDAQRDQGQCFANGCAGLRCAHRQWLRSAHGRAQRRLQALESTPRRRVARVARWARCRLYDASAEHVISLAVGVIAHSSDADAVDLLADCVTLARSRPPEQTASPALGLLSPAPLPQ